MKAHRRPRRYTVNLTAAQGRLLDTLAREFRADPGDMLAALAVGSICSLDGGGEAVPTIHAALLDIIVYGICPKVELPFSEVDTVNRSYQPQEAAEAGKEAA